MKMLSTIRKSNNFIIKMLLLITHMQVVACLEEEARAYALSKNRPDRINRF